MPENREVSLDLAGMMLTQAILDDVISLAHVAGKEVGSGGTVTIILKRVAGENVPHLIVDYGGIVHALAEELSRVRSQKQAAMQ